MQQIRPLSDQRHHAFCAHCGGAPSTREHIPPKVLLDKPYPKNLPVTQTCKSCNKGMSLDEEYLACWIECVKFGTTDPVNLQRPKIQKILERKLALKSRIDDQLSEDGTRVEVDRGRRVVLKLARCHAAYELSERVVEMPSNVGFSALTSLNEHDRQVFEECLYADLLPEVGSRAFQRRLNSPNPSKVPWITLQADRYRYMVFSSSVVLVRFVISNYFAGEVLWS